MYVKVCESMRQYATKIYGSKPTINDNMSQVVYSKHTIYDVSYMRLYATCRSMSWHNGRVAGLYNFYQL
jgi:hypothetical protein